MKSIILLLLVSSVFLKTTEDEAPELVSYLPNEKNVRFLGRTAIIKDILFLGHSNCGAEFSVKKATHLSVTIHGDSGAKGQETDSSARIVAFVNDERVLDTMITKEEETFPIFSNVEDEKAVEGTVQIIKVSECSSSMAGIVSIEANTDAVIAPTKEKDLKIEFIGDSITCGYGVDDLVKEHHFKTSTEDASKTYAYKAAKELNADYSFMSVSGAGIISGYSGNGEKQTSNLVPDYYEKLGFSWGSSFLGAELPQKVDWDFDKFKPDFIVINLGTNDNSYCKNDAEKMKDFQDTYTTFLKTVRSHNKDSYIICSLGIMGQDLFGSIEKAVDKYVSGSGDEKVTTLKFEVQNMNDDGIGADWHPSEKTHTKAGALLAAKIKELM